MRSARSQSASEPRRRGTPSAHRAAAASAGATAGSRAARRGAARATGEPGRATGSGGGCGSPPQVLSGRCPSQHPQAVNRLVTQPRAQALDQLMGLAAHRCRRTLPAATAMRPAGVSASSVGPSAARGAYRFGQASGSAARATKRVERRDRPPALPVAARMSSVARADAAGDTRVPSHRAAAHAGIGRDRAIAAPTRPAAARCFPPHRSTRGGGESAHGAGTCCRRSGFRPVSRSSSASCAVRNGARNPRAAVATPGRSCARPCAQRRSTTCGGQRSTRERQRRELPMSCAAGGSERLANTRRHQCSERRGRQCQRRRQPKFRAGAREALAQARHSRRTGAGSRSLRAAAHREARGSHAA